MYESNIRAHAQVVEALGGHAPRHTQQVVYQEGHTGQINAPQRNPRSNFRDRSNRRKTTGFEEIRQEYYNIHQNKQRAEPAEEVHVQGQSMEDPQDFFPKPSAFIRAPRRQLPPRRQTPSSMEDNELVGGPGFVNRGSKAADMFQRRRERSDQFILDQENETPTPAAHQTTPQSRQTMLMTQTSWDGSSSSHKQPAPTPRLQAHAPVQPRRTPPPQSRPHHQPQQMQAQQQYHQPQQQQHHRPQQQQYHPQPQQQQPQQHKKKHHPQPQQQHHRNHPPQGHTTVDSRRSRQPLAPKSTRFELNSPWKDPNMPIGNRFHPNVVPYQDSYNVSPKGWGRDVLHFGEDNNIKDHYEYTGTSEKFQFTPAPRINKFNNTMTTPFTENYNCRPKSWCDIELTASPSHRQRQPPPSRRAYPQHSQHNQSSVNQFTGQSSWGYGESDEL